jgi:spermidine/putrescine transport system permease protein
LAGGAATASSRAPRLGARRRRALIPIILLAPGLAWLAVFYLVPILTQVYVSLQEGNFEVGFEFAWNWSTYADALSTYRPQLLRSLQYAGMATVLAFVISFPLAYFIAFKAGRFKNLMLLLIVLPFFTSYLVRTVAWQTILADQGFVVARLQDVGVLAEDGRLLATTTAVVAGITYNFLPFMALPLYVSLEKIDRRLIEAATDLYASRVQAFFRVTLPLAVPGIFAGSLLTFIPAVGDFVNAQLLGTSRQYMIGNVIQSKFLVISDYPEAAALSFVLMAVLLVAIFAYARVLGARNLQEAAI